MREKSCRKQGYCTKEENEVNVHSLYAKNDDFRQYVDKYCVTQKIDKETALRHELVRQAAAYYMDKAQRLIAAE